MVQWSWKYADWVMVAAAVVFALFGIFLPSNQKELKEMAREQAERKAAWAAYHERVAKATAAHEELTKREREEYGIVYIPTIVPAAKPEDQKSVPRKAAPQQ